MSTAVDYAQAGELKFGQVGIANLRVRTLDVAQLVAEMRDRVQRAPNLFARAAVTISGEHKAHRAGSDSGRWNEGHFCPDCGTNVFSYVEAAPDDIIISAGCFADSSLRAPQILFWASQRHHWLKMPDTTKLLDSQPE